MAIRDDQRGVETGIERHRGAGGKLMIYGRPTLMWENAPSLEEYFKKENSGLSWRGP